MELKIKNKLLFVFYFQLHVFYMELNVFYMDHGVENKKQTCDHLGVLRQVIA